MLDRQMTMGSVVNHGREVSVTAANGTISYFDSMDDLPNEVHGDVHVGVEIPRAAPVAIPPAPLAIVYPDAPREPEPTTDDATKACIICMDRVKSTTAIPCGHVYACVTCIRTSKPKTCAMCRKTLTGVYSLFNS
jgi:hypothetical protein